MSFHQIDVPRPRPLHIPNIFAPEKQALLESKGNDKTLKNYGKGKIARIRAQ